MLLKNKNYLFIEIFVQDLQNKTVKLVIVQQLKTIFFLENYLEKFFCSGEKNVNFSLLLLDVESFALFWLLEKSYQ